MPFNVNEFLTSISESNGPMAPSRFEVTIVPSGQSKILPATAGITETRFINFSAFSAAIPGINFDSDYLLLKGYGRINEIPLRPTMGNCDISFYLDEKINVYKYLHNWMNSVVNMDGTLSAGGKNFEGYYNEVYYPDSYYCTVTITCFSYADRKIMDVVLDDCYPSELSGINMNWGNTDSNATATVSLVFRHMRLFHNENEYFIPRG